MSLKLYADFLSQPSRALALFLKANRIPHEFKNVSIMRGEHKSSEYVEKVHPFGKVPAIEENGNSMTESIAIVRYLARKYQVADNWYPRDLLGQARVDEFLEWHHLGLRMPLSSFFLLKFVRPMLTGKEPKEDQVKFWTNKMNIALDEVENIWLKNNPYLTGSTISVADLFGICEIEQPRMSHFDPTENRPRLTKWMKRVREELEPHYSEVMQPVNEIISQSKSKL